MSISMYRRRRLIAIVGSSPDPPTNYSRVGRCDSDSVFAVWSPSQLSCVGQSGVRFSITARMNPAARCSRTRRAAWHNRGWLDRVIDVDVGALVGAGQDRCVLGQVIRNSETTASSWRTYPKMNVLSHVHRVLGDRIPVNNPSSRRGITGLSHRCCRPRRPSRDQRWGRWIEDQSVSQWCCCGRSAGKAG